ncbi:MAG: hypothetical protein ACRDYC_08505, partial [Acidimicrobiales bacterium]
MTLNLDRPCEHEDFLAEVEVERVTKVDDGPVIGYCAHIHVWCAVCDERFRWVGVPGGLSPAQPMCSPDETELRAPIRPATSDPDFGMGIPGFAIRQVGRTVERPDLEGPRDDDPGGGGVLSHTQRLLSRV